MYYLGIIFSEILEHSKISHQKFLSNANFFSINLLKYRRSFRISHILVKNCPKIVPKILIFKDKYGKISGFFRIWIVCIVCILLFANNCLQQNCLCLHVCKQRCQVQFRTHTTSREENLLEPQTTTPRSQVKISRVL